MTEKIMPELESSTESWDAMTREERAVAVAHDVIALLRAKRLTAESGIYLRIETSERCSGDDDLRQVLIESTECRACAVGAVFVAKMTARNGVDVKSHCYARPHGLSANSRTSMMDAVNDAFSEYTLDLIEDAFEGGWKNEYQDDDDRLAAIMERVINNKGVFTDNDADEYGDYEDEEDDYEYDEDYDEDDEDWEDEDDDWDDED